MISLNPIFTAFSHPVKKQDDVIYEENIRSFSFGHITSAKIMLQDDRNKGVFSSPKEALKDDWDELIHSGLIYVPSAQRKEERKDIQGYREREGCLPTTIPET